MSLITAAERGELTLAVASRLTDRERAYLLIDLGPINVPAVPGCKAELLLAPFGDKWLVSFSLCRPDCTSVGRFGEVDPCLSDALGVVVGVASHLADLLSEEARERWEVVTDALHVYLEEQQPDVDDGRLTAEELHR